MVAQLDAAYIRQRPWKAVPRLISYALFEGRPLTTRGRWINPLVFAHMAVEKRLPMPRRVVQPIFIVGTGRSGTTILGKILSMHRDIGFLNEPKALWQSVIPDQDAIGNYTRTPGRLRFTEADATPEVRRRAHRLFAAYSIATGSRRVLDKYPEAIFRIGFLRAVFPDARIIFLARNGWDTVASVVRWSHDYRRSRDRGVEDWWGLGSRKWRCLVEEIVPQEPLLAGSRDTIAAFENDRDRAAVEWILTMQEGLRAVRKGQAHLLRYEELLSQPGTTLEELAAYCELQNDPVFNGYAESVLDPPREAIQSRMHEALEGTFNDTHKALRYD